MIPGRSGPMVIVDLSIKKAVKRPRNIPQAGRCATPTITTWTSSRNLALESCCVARDVCKKMESLSPSDQPFVTRLAKSNKVTKIDITKLTLAGGSSVKVYCKVIVLTGKACPNLTCDGILEIQACRGHGGYPVTHFWRHVPSLGILFQVRNWHIS